MGSGKAALRSPRFTIIVSMRPDSSGSRALASVQQQAFEDYEIICLMAESSGDDVLGDFKGKLLRVSDAASSAARNEALAQASGSIAAFISSEDVWHPNYLTYHARLYELFPETLFGFTNFYRKSSSGSGPVNQATEALEAPNPLLQMVVRPFVRTLSCLTAPLSWIRSVGGFNPAAQAYPETDFYIRLLAGPVSRKRLACLDRPVIGLPQIGVLSADPDDSSSKPDPAVEARQRAIFIEHVFSYPFMQRYERYRSEFQMTVSDEDRSN